MNKKLKIMLMHNIAKKIKGFIRISTQSFPITCVDCVDDDSLIKMNIEGNCYQDGEPTFNNPIEIQSVGERTANILVYPYSHTTKTDNGITFTDNGDGTITANGTATGNAYFQFTAGMGGRAFIKAGTYIISGNPSTCGMSLYLYENQTDSYISIIAVNNGATKVFTIDTDMYYYWYISVSSGKTVDNVTFSPMLINIQENNIFPEMTLTTHTLNGITFTNVGDNTVTVNGTFTGTASSVTLSQDFDFEPGKNYLLYNNSNSTVTFGVKYFDENGTVKYLVSQPQNSRSFTWDENWTFSSLYLQMNGTTGASVDETINPMLIQTDYAPYGYKIPIVAETENLFVEGIPTNGFWTSYINGEGIKGYGMAVSENAKAKTLFKASHTYTLSFDMEIIAKGTNGTYKNAHYGLTIYSPTLGQHILNGLSLEQPEVGERVHVNATATMPDNLDELTLSFYYYTGRYVDENGTTSDNDTIRFTDIKIEEADHETEPIVSNVYVKEPMNYKDVMNLKDKTLTRNYNRLALGTGCTMGKYSGGVLERPGVYIQGIGMLKSNRTKGFFTHAVSTPNMGDNIWFGYGNSHIYVLNEEWYNMAHADFLAMLDEQKANGTPVEIVYPLEEPITEKIIAPNLPTFKHGTTYSIATAVQPLSGTVEYYSTTKGE